MVKLVRGGSVINGAYPPSRFLMSYNSRPSLTQLSQMFDYRPNPNFYTLYPLVETNVIFVKDKFGLFVSSNISIFLNVKYKKPQEKA